MIEHSRRPLTIVWCWILVLLAGSASLSAADRRTRKVRLLPLASCVAQGGPLEQSRTVSGGAELAPARDCRVIPPGERNRPPIADAGPDQTVAGDLWTLDGSGSSDPDGDAIGYEWTLVSAPDGDPVALLSPHSAMPQLTIEVPGTYVVALVVNDGVFESSPDQIVITTEDSVGDPPSNSPPLADAGPDQTVAVGDTVTLDGSGSSDPDGDEFWYRWTLVSTPGASAAALSSTTAVTPQLIADLPGTYVVSLVVDDAVFDSAPDLVEITAQGSPNNSPPVADAGPDQTVAAGDMVNLNGSGSSDPDGDPLTYAWTLTSTPAGSAAALTSASSVMPLLATDLPGTYLVSLTVNDGTVDSAPDEVAITTGNSPPVADAGPDQTVPFGNGYILDGSGSTDVDGDPLTYAWSVVSAPPGSQTYIIDPTDVMPFFYGTYRGDHVLQLVVNDGQVDSVPDTVTMSSLNNPPVARAGADQSASHGTTVTLDGSLSSDVDGDPLAFAWSLLTVPAGSVASLSDPTAVMPQFDLDVDGIYVAQLIVDDGTFASSPDTVTVTAFNLAPLADAGADQTVLQGDSVTLDGTGSFDPELDPLLFTWSLLSAPANSAATLSDPAAVMPTFHADELGDYVAQLIVHDGQLGSPPDTVMISTANVPPVADAGPDQTLDAGTFFQLDGTASSDADGDALTYAWSIVSAPPTSFVVILDPTSSQPSYLLDDVGTYVLQLIVHDGTVPSAPDTVVIESLPAQRVLLLPESDLIGLGRTVPATVRLLAPPPPGGVVVTLSADDATLVGITPSSVTIPQGQDSAPVTLDGLLLGDTILRADAPNYAPGVTGVTVTDFLISLEQALVLAPGETSSLALSLSSPAPFGGQTVFLSSADPSIATITPSVFVPEGSQIPAANPQVTGGAIGVAQIHGSAGGYAPDTAEVTVTIDIWFPQSQLRLPLETRQATLQLSAPAPAGLTLDLSLDDPGIATVPATVTPLTGSTSVQVPVTGVADGQTLLRAGAPGIAEDTISIGVGSGISVVGQSGGPLFVGEDLQHRMTVILASPAPPAGRTVTVTSPDPSRLLLSAAPSDSGSASVSVFVPGGDQAELVWLHGLAGSGDAEVTTSAPAHVDGSDMASLYPSGFVFETPDFATTTLSQHVPVILGVRPLAPVSLDPIWTGLDGSAVRVGVSVTLEPASSDPAVGTILGNPLTFNGGDTRLAIDFDPVGVGQTTLSMATPAGFDTPASLTTIDATVSIPPIHLGGYSRVGYQLQENRSVTLGAVPPVPVDVTLTVDDPSIVVVSDDAAVGGAGTLVLTGVSVTGAGFVHLQGLAEGTATLTIEAPGYATTTESIEVVPSGFRFRSVSATISGNTLGPNRQLPMEAAVLNSQIVNPLSRGRELRPGVTIDVPVTSSDPGVAAVIGSPVAASGPFVPLQVEVDPLAAGTATIQIVQPPGFSTPSGRTQTTITVTAPGITITPNPLRIGRGLQTPNSFTLQAAPPSPVDVTITVGDASIATVTGDPALDGSDMLVVGGVTYSGPFSLQGRTPGTTTVTVAAPCFAPVTRTVEVTPSGFQVSTSSFPLSTFDSNRTITVRPVALDATSLQQIGNQPLRPGVSAQVEVVSSAPAVAGITTSPVSFSPGVLSRTTQLDPLTAGTTTVTAVPPAGFEMPATTGQFTVTITAPDVVIPQGVGVGLNLQRRITVTLADAPPGPVDVTVTSLAPSIGIVSVDQTVVGGSSVTFTSVTGQFVGYIWLQALGSGSTQIVAQAAGYNDGTTNMTVGPSGFVFSSTNDLTIPVSAANSTRTVKIAPLFPTTAEPIPTPIGEVGQRLRAGMTATVNVSSAEPAVAAVAAVPIVFTGGQSSGIFEVDPIAVGSTVFTVDPVTGFDTPAIQDRELLVTVDP